MTLAAIEFETYLPASFTAPGLSEREFLELCEQFPDCTLEYTADGEVVVMPPTDPETSKRVLEVGAQLRNWALSDSRGWAVGSDGGFFATM